MTPVPLRSKDNQILASMLNSLETRIVSEIQDLKTGHRTLSANQAELTTNQAIMLANQRASAEKHLAFREELLGKGGRVAELESRQKSFELWSNVKLLIVFPIVGAIHKIGTVLGLKI